jgi:hypothetical protein
VAKILIYIVNVSKFVAIKGITRKFLYMVAVHTEGKWRPPIVSVNTFFRVSVPLRLVIKIVQYMVTQTFVTKLSVVC